MALQSLKKNAAFNFIKALANFTFPLITFPYASRVLMPDGIGKINFVNSVIEYFVLIAELGVGSYAAREAAKIRDDKPKLNAFCRDIFCLNLISTASAFLLLIAAMLAVSKFGGYRALFVICSAKILFASTGMNWLFTAFEEFKYITMRSILFQIVCLVFLFVFVRTPDDYLYYGAMGVISFVGPNILNLCYSRKFINLFSRSKIHIKKHLKPVLIFLGTDCATKLHTTIDAVILGFMMSDLAVGYYSAASKINRIVYLVIATTLSTFMPRGSYYLENGKAGEYKSMVQKCENLTVFFALPAAAGLFLLAEPILELFCGVQYLPAVSTMKVLCPIIFINAAGTFLNQVIIVPQRKERIGLISQIIGCVLNVALNIPFISYWGVFGAAIATLIVETIITAVKAACCIDSIAGTGVLKEFLKAAAGTVGMGTAVFFIQGQTEGLWLKLIVSVFCGTAVYAAIAVALHHETAVSLAAAARGKLFKKKRPNR
ncbi:MAG: flippase [Bacteroides sp.]|nr:flippase [Prevotella sp.]MCM1407870.1 flippase [Treponema brennaborense]MCM1469612.1 flippase [Bacteroides sp.]